MASLFSAATELRRDLGASQFRQLKMKTRLEPDGDDDNRVIGRFRHLKMKEATAPPADHAKRQRVIAYS
jgi:hypothetical protein